MTLRRAQRVETVYGTPPRVWLGLELPQLLFFAALCLGFAYGNLCVLRYLREAQFHMDIWEMLLRGSNWSEFLSREAHNVFYGEDRVRPFKHFIIFGYAQIMGLDGPGFAVVLWGIVLAVYAVVAVFLVRLGWRVESAALASLIVLFGPSVLSTTYAHQYNDVILAALFTFIVLVLCLADRAAALWLILPLCALGILSHESGATTGGLLVIAHAYRSGIGSWRGWLLRRDTVAVLGLCMGYVALRAFGHVYMVGSSAIPANLLVLLRGCLGLLGGAGLICAIAAVSLARRGERDSGWAERLLWVIAWPLCAYSLFLLNRSYQSQNYFTVALVLPAAALVDPLLTWLFTRRHPRWLAAIGPAVLALAFMPWGIDQRLRSSDRIAGPLLDAILTHCRSTPPNAPIDVWIAEMGRRPGVWGRTFVEEEIAAYGPGESFAIKALLPKRSVPVHVVDLATLAYIQPRPTDLILVVTGTERQRHSIWRVVTGTSAVEPVHVGEVDGSAPSVALRQSVPLSGVGLEAYGRFWSHYADGDSAPLAALVKDIRRASRLNASGSEPAWFTAVRSAACLPSGRSGATG